MKVYTNEEIEQGSTEWLSFREGKITGTKLGKLYHKSRKDDELYDMNKPNLAYYELLAERLAEGTGDDDGLSSSRERGSELEAQALERAEEILGKKFNHGGVWQLNDRHIESPDGWTEDLKEAVEIKCLSSGRHLMAIMLNTAPKEYYGEYMNYFLVNEHLERLHVFLYDPRFVLGDLQTAVFTIERKGIESELARLREIIEETEKRLNRDAKWLLSR